MKPSTLSAAIKFASILTGGLGTVAHADLVAWWNFDNVGGGTVIPDVRAGLPGRLLSGAVRTPDGEGRTGSAGDRGGRFGVANERMHIADASYLTGAASGNVLSVSFWIKHVAIRNATPFSLVAPSIGGRAFQTHTPWSDGTMYFDTGGCCTGADHRIFVNPGATWTAWNHVALVKDGNTKTMYLNGVQVATGTNVAPISVAMTELFIGNGSNTTEAVNGDIDDVAIFSHALTAADAAALATGTPPVGLVGVSVTDSDDDGLPDQWEQRTAGNLTSLTGSAQDFDSDGLNNGAEYLGGTNPANPDTDNDGAPDGVETGTGVWVSAADRGTNPFVADTDGDGLKDGAETNTGSYFSPTNTGTNPLTADYDSDLVNDGMEVLYGSSPVNAASTPIVSGVPTLLAWWQFNDNSNPAQAADTRVGHVGSIQGSAAYSNDAEGFTGVAGDRALRVTAAGGKMRLENASAWINMATRLDKFTLSFWQKNATAVPPSGQSSFWFYSAAAGSASGFRGFQAHCPWSGQTVYFDSAGCCAAGTQRSNAVVSQDWSQWHHFVFMKNGTTKKVYVDGVDRFGSTNASPLPTDFTAINVSSDNGTGSMQGWIDEFAIFAAPLSVQDITDLATRTKTPGQIGSSADSDNDGLTDAWEYLYFPGDLTKLSAPLDFDGDGSTDGQELARDTDPTNPDTDSDSLFDGVETKTGVWVSNANTGTDPKKADTDGDGIPDYQENCSGNYVSAVNPGTNPNLADTDSDGFRDDLEILYGTNPNNAGSVLFPPGGKYLLAHWRFDDPSNPAVALDSVVNLPGTVTGTYSAPGLGRSGAPSDLAMCLTGGQAVTASAAFANIATAGDKITISFWQKLNVVQQSSAFWITSPSSATSRGIQAHAPWSDSNIYFDHSGCCNPGVERISGPLPAIDPLQWHHFAFIKDGANKSVYVDGILAVVGGSTAPLKTDLDQLIIGGGPAGYTSGCIDDFAIYAGALDAGQIVRLACGDTPASILQAEDPNTFNVIRVQRNGNGTVHLEWSSKPGCRYSIQGSTTLQPGSWTTLNSGISSGGALTVFDVVPLAGDRTFLRVIEGVPAGP